MYSKYAHAVLYIRLRKPLLEDSRLFFDMVDDKESNKVDNMSKVLKVSRIFFVDMVLVGNMASVDNMVLVGNMVSVGNMVLVNILAVGSNNHQNL